MCGKNARDIVQISIAMLLYWKAIIHIQENLAFLNVQGFETEEYMEIVKIDFIYKIIGKELSNLFTDFIFGGNHCMHCICL